MKISTITDHDLALAQIIAQQTAAAAAIGTRTSNAGRIVASFAAAPTEAALAATISAQLELDALAKVQDAMPPADRREAATRNSYAVQNRDSLVEILQSDIDSRLKEKTSWRKAKASEISRLSELLALAELPHPELVAAELRQDELSAALANAAHAEREATRHLAIFKADPSFENLANARASNSAVTF